ncbi:MAG: metallophosphoesterase [Proteobacteria bacterium]|nr:metallophosphoesterase [Pseudomonadota bacterium]
MTVRILHFTDVHFGTEDSRAVEAATAYAQENAHDLTVVSGDLTQTGVPAEFEAAAAWLKRLPGPVITCAGNHDTTYYNVAMRILKPWGRFKHWIGPVEGQEHRSPGLAVRTLNTARGIQMRRNWSKGRADLKDFRAAAEALNDCSDDTLQVIVCHHPLMEVLGEPITGDVTRGKQAAAILAEHRIDLVLGGHFHYPFAATYPVVDERTHGVGAGTLSTRRRGVPLSFGVIEADPTEIRVQAMDCDGGRICPGRSWALKRRKPFAPLKERHNEPELATPEGLPALDPTRHETTPPEIAAAQGAPAVAETAPREPTGV